MLGNPFAGNELLEQRLVEPSRRAIVDVLDDGLAVPHTGSAQPDLEASGVAIGGFAIEQECQPFGVCKLGSLCLVLLLDEASALPSSSLIRPGKVLAGHFRPSG
jgi:hypothetical protein